MDAELKEFLKTVGLLVLIATAAYGVGHYHGGVDAEKSAELRYNQRVSDVLRVVNDTLYACDVWWAKCRISTIYDPVLHQVLEIPPSTNRNVVMLQFGKGGNLSYTKFGGLTRSMSPSIEPGYIVIIQENPIDIRMGDIVAIPASLCGDKTTYENWYHRVLGIMNKNGTEYLITRGDNNRGIDECNVTSKDIRYRAVAIIPSTLEAYR